MAGKELPPYFYIGGQPVPAEPIDWSRDLPFLPSQARAVQDALRELARGAQVRGTLRQEYAVRWCWWPKVLKAAGETQRELQQEHIIRVTRRPARHMRDLARLAERKGSIPSDDVPEYLRDAILYGSSLLGFRAARIEGLASRQIKQAARVAHDSRLLSGKQAMAPLDAALFDEYVQKKQREEAEDRPGPTLSYVRVLSEIYRESTGNKYVKWGRTGAGPCGPGFRFVKACLAPLRPDLGPDAIVAILDKTITSKL